MKRWYSAPFFQFFSAQPAEEIGLNEGPTASGIPEEGLIPEDEW